MKILGFSPLGKKSLAEHMEILIGLSLNNSYFKTPTLEKIFYWSNQKFSRIDVVIPDRPAIYDLLSFGYPAKEARRKATLESNRLENKCKKIISELKIENKSNIIRWACISNNINYKKTYRKFLGLYNENNEFRSDVRELSREVILKHGTNLEIEKAIDLAVEFVLEEFAFIANAAKILEIQISTYLYHKRLPIYEKILNGNYGLKAPGNNGYILAKV